MVVLALLLITLPPPLFPCLFSLSLCSTLIMQLLRDNLTLWTSDQNEGDDAGANNEDGTRVEDL